MSEELPLENVFVIVDETVDLFDFDSQFPETSPNRLRGAWFAHDDEDDIIDDLSDVVYHSRETAEERARELGEEYSVSSYKPILIDILYYYGERACDNS